MFKRRPKEPDLTHRLARTNKKLQKVEAGLRKFHSFQKQTAGLKKMDDSTREDIDHLIGGAHKITVRALDLKAKIERKYNLREVRHHQDILWQLSHELADPNDYVKLSCLLALGPGEKTVSLPRDHQKAVHKLLVRWYAKELWQHLVKNGHHRTAEKCWKLLLGTTLPVGDSGEGIGQSVAAQVPLSPGRSDVQQITTDYDQLLWQLAECLVDFDDDGENLMAALSHYEHSHEQISLNHPQNGSPIKSDIIFTTLNKLFSAFWVFSTSSDPSLDDLSTYIRKTVDDILLSFSVGDVAMTNERHGRLCLAQELIEDQYLEQTELGLFFADQPPAWRAHMHVLPNSMQEHGHLVWVESDETLPSSGFYEFAQRNTADEHTRLFLAVASDSTAKDQWEDTCIRLEVRRPIVGSCPSTVDKDFLFTKRQRCAGVGVGSNALVQHSSGLFVGIEVIQTNLRKKKKLCLWNTKHRLGFGVDGLVTLI